jgi:xylan 1,4-beta-xylosidase
MTLKRFLSTAAILLAGTVTVSAAPGRNLFAEYLGVNNKAVDDKIDDAFRQLFYGNDATERVYYPVGKDMAYIYAPNSDDVRSEGMSYGMMIAVELDRKEEFDRLWKWAKTYMYHADGPRKGYFAWQCKKDGAIIDPGSASDGEEWFVTALFFASGRWGDGQGIYNYQAEANALLDAMLHKGDDARGEDRPINMFDAEKKQVRFVPLDNWAKVTDPSYQLPAFYELWALWAAKDNACWSSAAAASRIFFHKAANAETGLMPDYSDMDGNPFGDHGDFFFDAHRTLANVAMDWSWFAADPWQETQSNRVLSFLSAYRPKIPYGFTLNGKPLADGHSESITAMASVAALAADRKIGEPFVRDLWETPVPNGPYRYYNSLLYMIGLLQTSGRFNAYAPEGKPVPFAAAEKAVFRNFEYKGDDTVFNAPAGKDDYRNPILPGYRPDPSICRAGDDYYLVNSSFSYFPGVPIYKSRDLVHWKQIGHVLDRPSQLPLDGATVSQGIFAPALSYHDGTFYMITTNVSGGGNFYVTAKNPAGPWSEPVWLNEVNGIDTSFYFDDATGRAWVVNNGPAPDNKPQYEGHRAIWIQEFDAAKGQMVGPRKIIVNGGVNIATKPIWIEGPHIFRHGEWLYLICAEGGTRQDHSEVVFRSKNVLGPWVPYGKNPILTQRDLPDNRPNPVTSTGHAGFVDAGAAGWWSVFLGCRPYEGDNYVTGRETFMLPVTWTADGWPVVLEKGKAVPYVLKSPALPQDSADGCLQSGNFTFRDSFTSRSLKFDWMMLRTPHETWIAPEKIGLFLQPRAIGLNSLRQPSFLGFRVQHTHCEMSLEVMPPTDTRIDSGLALLQNENFNFFIGIRRDGEGYEAFVEERAGGVAKTLARKSLKKISGPETVRLSAKIDANKCSFYMATGNAKPEKLADADASILTTNVAGGFVGTMAGPYARTR